VFYIQRTGAGNECNLSETRFLADDHFALQLIASIVVVT